MPPKIKITKESILETAFRITREKGIEYVNARELAHSLNCSTQPVFRCYANMEELKQDLYNKAECFYNEYMENGMQHPNPFLGMGLAYIQFAKKERFLFKLLFMTEHFKIISFFDMIDNTENQVIITMISKMAGISEALAKEFYIDIWLVTHGIASMMAFNSCNLRQEEIEKILADSYYGFLLRLKERT